MRKRTAWILLATGLGLAFLLTIGQAIRAQGVGDEDDNIPFHLNGHAWRSKKAFIESGARCATRHVDEIEGDEVEKNIRKVANGRGGPGGQGTSDGSDVAASTTSAPISVYFHVINKGSVNGDVPDSQISAQINVLNAAYRLRLFLRFGWHRPNNQWHLVYGRARFSGRSANEGRSPRSAPQKRSAHLHEQSGWRLAGMGHVPLELQQQSQQ